MHPRHPFRILPEFWDSNHPAIGLFGPGVDDDARETALARTADLARKIRAIASHAELPAEAVPSLFEVYLHHVDQVVAERRAAKILNRYPMEISSGSTRILPGQCAQIISRSQCALYRVEDIEISEHAERWFVLDIIVGNRSQKVCSGKGIAGKHFAKDGVNPTPSGVDGVQLRALMRDLRLELLHGPMDFTLVVEYRGPVVEGEPFRAQAIGTAAAYSF